MELNTFIHHYCLFYKDGSLVAGWVEGIQKNKLIISPLQGKHQLLPPNRVGVFWKNTSQEIQKPSALEKLPPQIEQAQKFAQAQELEVIHELSEPGKSYTLEVLVSDFLDNPEDPLQRVGLFLALEQDRRFFKRKNNFYTARTLEELAQIDLKHQQEKEQRLREAKVHQWILDIESGEWNAQTSASEEQLLWIQQVQSVLIYGKNSGYWKMIAPIFHLNATLNEEEENKLRKLLLQVGHPISQGRLILLRASVKEDFPQEVLETANQLSQRPLFRRDRKNRTHLPTFTIDSKKTRDYDDAFSILEWTENRIDIALHIADLSEFIQPGNPLFEEAETRISSVYTLKKVFPMLPPLLSEDYFSLKAGEERSVMSFSFNLFRNGEWLCKDIEFSLVQVDQNLSYEQADCSIEQEDTFWGIFSNCCQAMRQKRIAQGALDFERKEVDIDISNPDQIRITPINRNSPANMLVEELAILVNQEVGKFYKEFQCPGIYRVQAPYEMIHELKEGEKLTPRHMVIEPVRLSTHPEKHAGLGCDYYIQATSPIRRFSDLVAQYQLAHYLRNGEIVFEEEQLMGWAEQIQTTQRVYAKAEREIADYWKAKYLSQHMGEVFSATIKRHFRMGNTEVNFEEIQYTVQVSNLSQNEPGDRVSLKIENVDTDRHFIVVSVDASGQENL